MTDQPEPSQYDKGAEIYRQIYGPTAVVVPEGAMVFNDVMMKSLFAEVWTREVLSIRERRLLVMGVLASHGVADAWKVHARAALENGELTPEQLRETLVLLAPYAGYPCVNSLIAPTETAIHEWNKAGHVHSHES
jgi:4-carboxymuconolactone decarboxylase